MTDHPNPKTAEREETRRVKKDCTTIYETPKTTKMMTHTSKFFFYAVCECQDHLFFFYERNVPARERIHA